MPSTTTTKSQKKNKSPLLRVFRPQLAKEGHANPAVVTIEKPRDAVYSFMRDFNHFPNFAENILAVDGADSRFTWTIRAANKREQVAAIITRDVPGTVIEWTLSHQDGSQDLCSASFFDDVRENACIVTLQMGTDREPGKIVGVLDFFLGKRARSESVRTLRRLKGFLETGEIATIQGQPSGREPSAH